MDWIKASVDYGIMGILILLSIVSLSLILERWSILRTVSVVAYSDKQAFELFITRKLHLLATIGSNAPYVGLLGTVLGIMVTFYTIGNHGMMESGKIMTGLALALKATAMGLLAAIPSIVCYNLFVRKVKILLIEWDMHHAKSTKMVPPAAN